MHSKYKIIIIVLSLLLMLSIGISVVNYKISLDSTQKQLITQSLPLSVDNIYTEIQKRIIEPYLVSSMMANDTFVLDWLQKEESSVLKIQCYLESIKTRHDILAAFLVSEKTHNYYTENGFIEEIQATKEAHSWYFTFKNSSKKDAINIDLNEQLAYQPIMFINFKMFDKKNNYLGVTGVALEVSYIQKMFETFKEKYHLNVMFLDNAGSFILSKDATALKSNILDIEELLPFKEVLLSKKSSIIEYQKNGSKYIIQTKYIKELRAHLLVEAKLEDFTHETKKAFYLNISFSLLLAFIIASILISIIENYNQELEVLSQIDELTNIPNRRNFHTQFEYLTNLENRSSKQISLLYIDIDNFKMINDKYGHDYGDNILIEFSKILHNSVRKSDLYARWGGEEFIVAFTHTTLEKAQDLAEKIRLSVEESIILEDELHKPTTISLGLTQLREDDTLDTVISRADEAMYIAKSKGKNRVCIL